MRRLTFALPLLLLLVTPSARAASRLVTNLNDGGAGSLRQTIQDYAPGDSIRFAPGLTGTILNQDAPYQFLRPVTVVGPGADVLAVSGGDLRPIFLVSNGDVRISGLTIRNGRSLWGSAISSSDSLRVTRCTFRANRGTNGSGAILASGFLEITECTFENNVSDTGNGGAMTTAAYTTILGSTFRANSGGAIEASGTFLIASSTFFGNSNDLGGALRLLGAPQSVIDCTISGNTAFVQGGGVYTQDLLGPQLANTIVAGNFGTHPDVHGPFGSLGYNLIGDATGSTGFGTPSTHDQVGAPGNPIDPNLAPIGDYGGPTWTMPPRPGSPAIDQGEAYFPTDQRGRARYYDHPGYLNAVGGNAGDVGAYEIRPGLRTVTTLADAGAGSLRQTVADLHPFDADSIKFAANVRGTITLTSGPITCTKPGAIVGPRSWDLAIHGNNASRIFAVNPNVAFDLLGLTLTGGRDYDGIAVLASGNTTLRNCRLVGNNVIPDQFSLGGVIREVPPATLTVENCTIANNAPGFGGGILTGFGAGAGGSTIVANSTISGNSGAGIVDAGSNLIVLQSTITNNAGGAGAADAGGIWWLQGPSIALGGTIVAGNTGTADVVGPFTSSGYNLIGKVGTATGLVHGVNHDRAGTAASPIAPGLGPLLANGGPGETHALLVGSPAIDKGIMFRVLDQRGAARYNDPAVANEADGTDIGAYERNPSSTVAVDPQPPLQTGVVLESPRPNPAAAGVTAFASRLESAGAVTLDIYDVSGRRVRNLVSATRAAGSYTDAWDGRDDGGRTVRAGVYFARLVVGGQAAGRNLVVLP
jgi:predicted outer membrane repeat protein